MARNGSGTYSLASGNPVVTGTTISSTWANNTLSDIATALTQSLAVDGQTVPTANLPMATYKHTGVGDAAARTQYASAGQVQDGTLQHLTSPSGSNTITATAPLAMIAYAAGQRFSFIPAASNTGAATLNINSIGAKSILRNGSMALVGGELPINSVVLVEYDGTQFQLLTPVQSGNNALINGSMRVAQRADLTLGSSSPAANAGYGKVDRWQAWATGTAVSAGTATQDTAASVGSSGYALKLSGVTLTGSGVVYARYRMEAADAVAFKNQTCSFAIQCRHDVGSTLTYTVTINKADVADTFSAVTNIGSATTSVATGTNVMVTLSALAMGDCSNGIEIEVKAAAGAITTKNFWFAEAQFNVGPTANIFVYARLADERQACKRYYEFVSGVQDMFLTSWCQNATTAYAGIRFTVQKRSTPTVTFSGEFGKSGTVSTYTGTSTATANSTGFEGYTSAGTFTAGEAGYCYATYTAAAEL